MVLGILHIVIGVIAISFVTGGGGGEADQGGAMEQIAEAPVGRPAALAHRARARRARDLADRRGVPGAQPDTKKKWGYRAKYIGTAVAYLGIAITALVYALGGSPIRRSRRSRSARS